MQTEVMFAGFGGQGILSSGKILAYAAMQKGFEVIWIPSYGPEMRGGTAYCMVFISDQAIGSPVIKNPTHLVAMNRPSLEKFAPFIKKNGIILINSSLIQINSGREDINEIVVPVNDIAKHIGSSKSANIVALSAFVTHSRLIDFETLCMSIEKEFAKKTALIPLCLAAAEAGREAVGESRVQ